MRIIVDTREQKNSHILKYFAIHDIDYIEKKLDVADYQIEGKTDIAIDRKQNLDELARNLMNRADHSRFWKEVRRAKEQGTKMIVLCEHGGQIKSIPDVSGWHSKYSPVSGRALMDEIYRVHIAYGVEFLFCSKRSTAKRILELLGWRNEI
ncbi:MAG: ERCC4 domain-containing protein [Acutalibacteraceae bacterium]|nr:ERCC4 domain-containing protein [Acutalibacteraceae bacterium]